MNHVIKQPKFGVGQLVTTTWTCGKCGSSPILEVLTAERGVGQFDQPSYRVRVLKKCCSPELEAWGRFEKEIGANFVQESLTSVSALYDLAAQADD